jgi:predicted nuclease of predicted toxin-antitoxin system
MKLLFDNNLSPKLVDRLVDLFPGSSHVSLSGLSTASDIEVWHVARKDGYHLVSKDSDFNDLLASKGFPPKVIWIRLGNCMTRQIEQLLRKYYDAIVEFDDDANVGILELQ